MKNLFYLAVFICTFRTAFAQTEKGRMMLGGTINFNQNGIITNPLNNSYSKDESRNYRYNLGINFGYFFKDRIMIGLNTNMGYSQSVQTRSQNYGGTSTISKGKNFIENYSVGVFGRIYKALYKDKLALYGQMGINYGWGYTYQTYHNESYNDTLSFVNISNSKSQDLAVSFRLNPGIVYFVGKQLALEASFGNIGFEFLRRKYYSNGQMVNNQNTASVSSGLFFSLTSLNLGINFYFGKSKKAAETKT